MNNFISFKEYCRSVNWNFPKAKAITQIDFENFNLKKIFPLKQKIVLDILTSNIVKDLCDYIIIYGSSINMSCSKRSDLDICISLKENSDENFRKVYDEIKILSNNNFDITCLNDCELNDNSQFTRNIKKGIRYNV